jgi:hypothetical protein
VRDRERKAQPLRLPARSDARRQALEDDLPAQSVGNRVPDAGRLAGELVRDGMPASDVASNRTYSKVPAHPVLVFVHEANESPLAWFHPVADRPLTFTASAMSADGAGQVAVRLTPIYRVHHQRFALNWKLLKPEVK